MTDDTDEVGETVRQSLLCFQDVFQQVSWLCLQHLWEETSRLKEDLEDMEKKLVDGKMEIERTMDDYLKLKVFDGHWHSCVAHLISDVTISKLRFSIDFDSIFSPK